MKLQRYYLSGILVFLTLMLSDVQMARAEMPLGLSNCIEQALDKNPALRATREAVNKTEARMGEVGSERYPTLSLSGSARRFSTVGPVGENYTGGFSARYDLYQGGRIGARIKGAELSVQGAKLLYVRSRQDIVFRVTEAYYRVLEQARLVEVAEQRVETTVVHLSFAQAQFNAGLVSRSDTLRAAVEQSNATLGLIRVRSDLLTAQGVLNLLLGREAHVPLSLVTDPDFEKTPKVTDFENYLALALRQRPEFQRIEVAIRQQRTEIRVARADYLPSIAVDGSYTWNGPGLTSIDRDWRGGVTLSLPLFTGFSRSSRVTQARIVLRQLEEEQVALQQEIGRQVWDAHLAVREARERIVQTAVLVEQARERLAVAEGEYREGVGSIIEVVDAQTALVEAEEERVAGFADSHVALARLNRSVGNPFAR